MNRLQYFYILATTTFDLRNKSFLNHFLEGKNEVKISNLETVLDEVISADEAVKQDPTKEKLLAQKEAYDKLKDSKTFWYGNFNRANKIKGKLQKLIPQFFVTTPFDDKGWKIFGDVTFVCNRFGIEFHISWKVVTSTQASKYNDVSGKYTVDIRVLKGVYGIRVSSEHPLQVSKGGSVSFDVLINEGYSKDDFALSDGAIWDSDNVVKLSNVQKDTLIQITRK